MSELIRGVDKIDGGVGFFLVSKREREKGKKPPPKNGRERLPEKK